MAGKRYRNWTFIVYPESVPKNWRSKLEDTHVPWIESPLHDKDTNPDGTVKKAHWHIMMMFDGVQSYEQIKACTDWLNAPHPQHIASAKGMIRYMIHMDNPEKYQYNRSDIVPHCGADIDALFDMSTTVRHEYMKDIITFIYDNQITNFIEFLMYCIKNNDDWFTIAIDRSTLAINRAIDAEYQLVQKKAQKQN